jgi:WW domain-containing oxidoreductase
MTRQWQFDKRSTADDIVAGRDLSGRIVVITGANTGIGYETARAVASVGARVVLACRQRHSGEAAVARIRQVYPQAHVEFAQLDLASLPAVRRFCDALALPKIDILICNAGSMSTQYLETEQGFERTLGVCHIGHFLLAQQLLPKLLAAGKPRVVMLSSEAHKQPRTLDFDHLPYPRESYATMKAYGQAKLCNALMALELQNRYGDQGLTACSVHPGNMVTTDFGRESLWVRIAFRLVSPFTKTPNQGAATTVFCALHEPTADIAGGYFADCQPAQCTPEAKNALVAQRLWDLSEQWVAA